MPEIQCPSGRARRQLLDLTREAVGGVLDGLDGPEATGPAEEKIQSLMAPGIHVAESPASLGETVEERALEKK